jgi:putative DNA primase/helicase
VDLRTGELGAHDPALLQTKLAGARYDPDARSARWDEFLEQLSDADGELIAYLRRAVGYIITGHITEEAMFFAHGPAATGKTTFIESIRAVLGEYARTASFGTFLERREHGPRNDLARLAGARLVASSEVGPGGRFDAQTVKAMTGGDTITARYLYREPFEFRPTFKVWLAANERPAIDHNDDAMWRRVHAIPFLHVVPKHKRNPDLKRALTTDPDERAAILAWAVRGCLEWQRDGLAPPKTVQDYTAGYRAENDLLLDWLDECCQLGPEHRATRSSVRWSYEDWCERAGIQPLDAKAFTAEMRTRGMKETKREGMRYWVGVGVGVQRRAAGTPDEGATCPGEKADDHGGSEGPRGSRGTRGSSSDNLPPTRAREDDLSQDVPHVPHVPRDGEGEPVETDR